MGGGVIGTALHNAHRIGTVLNMNRFRILGLALVLLIQYTQQMNTESILHL